jgi:SAM-dependent methyltransferase
MDDASIHEMYALEDRHWWFLGKRLLVEALLSSVDLRGRRVLDVGCGTGGVLSSLAGRAIAVGVDRSPTALAYCRRRGIVHLACADGDRLPFAPASFDAITMLDVLEHFADEAALLASVRALLRPGGTLLVSVPAFQFLWSGHDEILQHVRRYTAGRLRRVLAEAGLVVDRLTYTNVVAFPPAVIVRGVLARLRRDGGGATDFQGHGPLVNGSLLATYRMEAAAIRRGWRLPVGLSVAAVVRRPDH